MKTYRVQYQTNRGSKLLDPTVFKTRKAAEMRIAALIIREKAIIKVFQRAEGRAETR